MSLIILAEDLKWIWRISEEISRLNSDGAIMARRSWWSPDSESSLKLKSSKDFTCNHPAETNELNVDPIENEQ